MAFKWFVVCGHPVLGNLMRESRVEGRLTAGVKRLGGMSIKIVPYWAGLPDRLILLPGGRMFLIETKAPGGRLRPVQRVWHQKAAAIGVHVVVLSTLEEVDVWLHQQGGDA